MTPTRFFALTALPLLALAAGCAKKGELVVDSGVGVTALRTACPTVGVPDFTGDITQFSAPDRRDRRGVARALPRDRRAQGRGHLLCHLEPPGRGQGDCGGLRSGAGHRGHPEVIGTFGQVAAGAITLVETVEDVAALDFPTDGALAFLTQTTLSVDDTAEIVAALRARFPAIAGPKAEDICYATSNRQTAVKAIAADCELVLVIGAPNSSNSLRLVEVAERMGTPARLIQRAIEINRSWLDGVTTLGLTAGASAPETLVREVVDTLGQWREVHEETVVSAEERIVFKLPRQLVA